MLARVREQVRPAGEIERVRVMLPVKPPLDATLSVELALVFASTVELVGLTVIVKSDCATSKTTLLI